MDLKLLLPLHFVHAKLNLSAMIISKKKWFSNIASKWKQIQIVLDTIG